MKDLNLVLAACQAGAADLLRYATLLDAINVFPVVDGDTGANMSNTLKPVLDASSITDKLSSKILVDARGNSGVILGQFIVGFFDSFDRHDSISLETMTQAVSAGKTQAYNAVSKPVEGTILTVMTRLEELLIKHGNNFDFNDHATLEIELAKTVADTQRKMERLAAAGVVDSGALGFHIFACGLTMAAAAITNKTKGIEHIRMRAAGDTFAPLGDISKKIDPVFLKNASNDTTGFRYCVDVVLNLDKELPQNWRDQLVKSGGSIDVAQRRNLLKLHVHTNEPDALKQMASSFGKIVHFSTTDMSKEFVKVVAEATFELKTPMVRIIGDSSMSLSRELRLEHSIDQLDAYINVYGEMIRDSDLDRDALFKGMKHGVVFKTASPSIKDAQQFISGTAEVAKLVLYIGVGSAYTSIQDLVRSAVGADNTNVVIVDTHAASGQQGIVALACAIKAKETHTKNELIAFAKNQADTAKEYLIINDLKYLSRSGRIGKIKAAAAGALSLKPIIGHGVSGAITYAKTRSHKAALNKITGWISSHPGSGRLLVLLEYTDNKDWLKTVRKQLESILPQTTKFYESPLSATSAVHMGPGTWGIAVTRI